MACFTILTLILGMSVCVKQGLAHEGSCVHRKATDKDVVDASHFALSAVTAMKITGRRILEVASQVVAETNDQLHLFVNDRSGKKAGKRGATIVVYQNLDDRYQLTSGRRHGE